MKSGPSRLVFRNGFSVGMKQARMETRAGNAFAAGIKKEPWGEPCLGFSEGFVASGEFGSGDEKDRIFVRLKLF